jgi:hypothetical protein
MDAVETKGGTCDGPIQEDGTDGASTRMFQQSTSRRRWTTMCEDEHTQYTQTHQKKFTCNSISNFSLSTGQCDRAQWRLPSINPHGKQMTFLRVNFPLPPSFSLTVRPNRSKFFNREKITHWTGLAFISKQENDVGVYGRSLDGQLRSDGPTRRHFAWRYRERESPAKS